MTDQARQETIHLAMCVGFVRGLRFAAHVCREAGRRDLAIKLGDLARSDLTYKLANMEEVDAQLVFAAALSDCSPPPAPIKRKPMLVLISNNKPADAWGWAGP
jgi:hypothetical protein